MAPSVTTAQHYLNLEKELERVAHHMQVDIREHAEKQQQSRLTQGPIRLPPLTPYTEVREARFLNRLPDEPKGDYGYRYMATGLCDPCVNLTMDRVLLPKVPIRQRHPMHVRGRGSQQRDRPPKEGSTRLPKFPVVKLPTDDQYWSDLVSKTLWYNDVAELREKINETYGLAVPGRIQQDYIKMKQDFYRMELDRFDAYHPQNRQRMKMIYRAYLQNTPGSRLALEDCIRESEKALLANNPSYAAQLVH